MADRTVSVRLRAQVGDFVAEMNLAGSAVDDFGRKVDGTSKKTTDSFTRTGRSTEKSATLMRSELTSLIAAAVAVSPPFIAAGAAAVAFGAVAVPSIVKVVTAQKDLSAGWSTLDGAQKATSANLTGLIAQYKGLAASYEPQALALFNDAIGDTEVLMQRARPLIDAGAVGVQHFTSDVDSFVTGGTMTQFLNFAARATPQAFDQLGTTFTETGTLALNLVQDLAPMGTTLLSTANGGLQLLNTLEQIDPHLAEFGLTALALRGPTQKLGELWTKGAGKLSGLAKEGSRAESFLGKLGKTLGAAPNLYVGAALGIGYLVARLATMKDSTDNLIASVQTETNAVGNNAAGHLAAAASFGRYITQAKAAAAAANSDGAASENNSAAISRQQETIKKLTEARRDELTAVKNITAGQNSLATQYGISAQQAGQLATAAGVDLSKGITGSGDAAIAARAKIAAYVDALKKAQNPTFVIGQALLAAGNNALPLKDRMTALANAFNALAGPEIAAFDATTKTADAFARLDAALKRSHGSMSLNSAAGRAARDAFTNLFATVEQNIQAQYQFESATLGPARALQNLTGRARALLPVLLAEAGGNKKAQQAVLDWANSAGVGKTRTDALAAALGTTRAQFLAAAHDAGVSRGEALKLWAAYQPLRAPLKLKVDDAEFLDRLHNAQGLRIDPKTGKFLGNNADYFNKWLKAKGLRIDPKTGKFLGNNADYFNKWLKVNGLKINPKTGQIKGNSSAFWAAVHAIPQVVGTRTIQIHYTGARAIRPELRAHGGIVHRAAGGPVQHMADGGPNGFVTGPGTTTSDSIPTMLSNKEFVINAASTAKYRPLVEAINADRLTEVLRHLVNGIPAARASAAPGAAGASGPVIYQTFHTQDMDRAELARDVARETAWIIG